MSRIYNEIPCFELLYYVVYDACCVIVSPMRKQKKNSDICACNFVSFLNYICLCIWCACVWRPEINIWESFLIVLHTVVWGRVSWLNMVTLTSCLFQGFPWLCLLSTRITGRPLCPPGIFMGTGDLNFHLYACTASAFSTKLSPLPLFPPIINKGSQIKFISSRKLIDGSWNAK